MRSLKFLAILLSIGLLLAAVWWFTASDNKSQQENLTYQARVAPFSVTVMATGELNAKRSVKIRGPRTMQSVGIYQTTISEMVPEGSELKKGDFVANLDRTELATKMSTVQSEIDKIKTQLEQAKIDTAIELRGLRDEIINTEFAKQEKQLYLEQSRFEPQSVIQQAQLDLEKTERDYKQLVRKYELKQDQAKAKIAEIMTGLTQNQDEFNRLAKMSQEFRITAPEDGMLIYTRTWDGKKEPGSRVSAWDPVVAELPDLSDMISTTYVNEVDISQVQAGQDVTIQVDAFPERSYTGQVIKVANIGEQLRGYDAKVFEVIVQMHETDSILRPAMTTSNEIVVYQTDEALALPLEAVFADSITYIYKDLRSGVVRQEVLTGLTNDDAIIIEAGLEPGQTVLLAPPPAGETLDLISLPPELKADVRAKQTAEARARAEEAQRRKTAVRATNTASAASGGSQ